MNTDINEKVKLAFKQLGQNIQKLRLERKLSIKDLYEMTGIRREYLKKIEDGTAYGVIIERHLVKIAKALRIKLHVLLDFELKESSK